MSIQPRKVKITDTTLRDAHQSLIATRMQTEDMLPIAELMDSIGYHSLEVWGGATFDTCMRFLDEDPWDRLRLLKEKFKNTKLQMLLRGQNIVGYHHYADDVVAKFIYHAVQNGIDIIRIFDALNDLRNMERAIYYTRQEGAHAQGTISYTVSPLHDIAHFVEMGKQLKDLGSDSICIKDMAGLITPYDAYELVKSLKEETDLPVQLHCHYTSGMASMSYLKAIEAGCDVIDTAASPVSLGASQPPTESFVAALKGTSYDTGLDITMLARVAEHFKEILKKYEIPLDAVQGVDTNVLSYQIPGGMISNLASQLAQQKYSHLLGDVLKEIPRVRKELGYPPLVTPSSQIVGTQAVMNVMSGERYKVIITEVKNYMKGLYGKPPGPVDPELLKKVINGEKPFEGRPADLLEPQVEKAREEIKEYMIQEEDILSYILFPSVALPFFKKRQEKQGTAGKAANSNNPAGQPGNNNSASKNKVITYNWDSYYLVDSSLLLERNGVQSPVYPV